MRKSGLTALFLFAAILARGEPLLSTEEGTTWSYNSTEETGGPGAGPAVSAVVTVTWDAKTSTAKSSSSSKPAPMIAWSRPS